MERWAANTLRTLGIILISGCVLLGCGVLLLFSMCAYSGDFGGHKHPEQGPLYIGAAAAVLALGVWAVAVLGRGISRSSETASQPPPSPSAPQVPLVSQGDHTVPLHLSPAGRRATNHLIAAIAAQLVVSVVIWLLNQRVFWTYPAGFAPRGLVLYLTISYFLYQVPYVILIVALHRHPDRRAFTYSIALPAVLIIQTLFSSSLVGYYFIRHPIGIGLLGLPWILDILILVLAYKAIQQVGLHPKPSGLIVAAVVTFVYFSCIHVVTPFMYRLGR